MLICDMMKCLNTECSNSKIPGQNVSDSQSKLLDLHENAAHSIFSTTLPIQAAAVPARIKKYDQPKLELKDGMVAVSIHYCD